MTTVHPAIKLEQQEYFPGEELVGAIQLREPSGKYTIELSVLWSTEGKGDEDLGVILFQEWSSAGNPFDFRQPHWFYVRLPRTPLSYDGTLIKIRWLARVRVRWGKNAEELVEAPFLMTSNMDLLS